MNKTKIIFVLFVLNSLFSTGQEYYEIYPTVSVEVQNKMNDNKILGVHILSDIEANHILVVSGIETNKRAQLEELLTNEDIYKFEISADLKVVKLSAQAKLKNLAIKNILSLVGGQIIGQTTTYQIHQ